MTTSSVFSDPPPSTTTAEWMTRNKGPYLRTSGYVWACDDPFCDCTQALLVEYYRDLSNKRRIISTVIWYAPVHRDGESGAHEELIAKRAELRETDPDYAARIEWHIKEDWIIKED